MSRQVHNSPFLTGDDGRKIVGWKNPEGSDTDIFAEITNSHSAENLESSFAAGGKAKATSWELRGLPEDYQGLIFFRDVGIGGSFWYSDGFRFIRTSPITLAVFNNLAFDQTDTTEKALARFYMMGGLMGSDGELVFEAFLSTANSANAKTLRIKAGSDSSPTTIGSTAPTNIASTNIYHKWSNVASQSSQVYYPSISAPFATTTSALSTSAVVTSSDFWIQITGQLANIADTATVNKLIITLR